MDLDRLDRLATRVAQGERYGTGVLSTGEALYVALAANNTDMLRERGYTIAESLARLGEEDVAELIERWRYRGDPGRIA